MQSKHLLRADKKNQVQKQSFPERTVFLRKNMKSHLQRMRIQMWRLCKNKKQVSLKIYTQQKKTRKKYMYALDIQRCHMGYSNALCATTPSDDAKRRCSEQCKCPENNVGYFVAHPHINITFNSNTGKYIFWMLICAFKLKTNLKFNKEINLIEQSIGKNKLIGQYI